MFTTKEFVQSIQLFLLSSGPDLV